MSGTLVLLRHGQSDWNLKNLFTGWKDPDLTEKGVEEAKGAGERLKAAGYHFDIAFTSELSRAQRTLTMTYCAKRKSFGEFTSCEPSRFLAELPQEDLEWEGRGDSDPAQNQKRGGETLASLRDILG